MGMEDLNGYRKYDQVNQVFNKNGTFRANCSTIIFRNQGTQTVVLDLLRLLPGESYTLEGYPGEMNMHTYDITFENMKEPGMELWIGMKMYVSHFNEAIK